jgi:hypothetical protein
VSPLQAEANALNLLTQSTEQTFSLKSLHNYKNRCHRSRRQAFVDCG